MKTTVLTKFLERPKITSPLPRVQKARRKEEKWKKIK
tara:strand:- start:885 stop:995 length:111 start_codon:yes stop_codon:yes gene_type:complete